LGNVSQATDEVVVEVAEPDEFSDPTDILWGLPIVHSLYLAVLHLKTLL
jgi:hypothetical protein